jgi:hypothetical protein
VVRLKKIFLVFVIILMCILVAFAGNFIFINSNSVLKQNRKSSNTVKPKDLRIFINIPEKKLYVISEDKIIKNYPIASGTNETPSPIGNWKVTSKATWGKGFGGKWMGINVPWGQYGIHGTSKPWSVGSAASHGCIRLRNKDAEELYELVENGTPVKIYGGPFGAFGEGFRVLKPGDRGSDVYVSQKISLAFKSFLNLINI